MSMHEKLNATMINRDTNAYAELLHEDCIFVFHTLSNGFAYVTVSCYSYVHNFLFGILLSALLTHVGVIQSIGLSNNLNPSCNVPKG